MRTDVLLLAMVLLATGCASVTPAPGRDGAPGYAPLAASAPALGEARGDESPRPSVYPLRMRSHGTHDDATRVAPGPVWGGTRRAATARQAVLDAIGEVKRSMEGTDAALARLASRPPSVGGRGLDGVFTRYLDHGSNQRVWLRGALRSATSLATAASEVEDPDMALAVLRMSGARLQAAMFGALLLATWVDFLQLADAVLRDCPMCGSEKLFADLHRVQGLMTPTLTGLASGDSERIEAAATATPELMGTLTREFDVLQRDARSAMALGGRVMVATQVLELLTLVSTLKMSLPRLPPAAPATLGVGLVMSSGGVMAGSRLVVSAEWVELMRGLVRAGVISLPAVSAMVRIHGGQVMLSQAHQDLPKGVRAALGDSPEVRGMRVTGKAGAGMSEAPRHHVLPKEHREWFEQRGFKGDMDIDQFCVWLERANHEAIHGGGNWKLGRTWPGEWNRTVMETLLDAEVEAGRRLTRNQVLDIVAERMTFYRIPLTFTKGRSR
ncbi:DUF2380 domain-containing protein [Corallococcus macrosporus]|nr:hypothetical protein [Corallococcus macrosporus]